VIPATARAADLALDHPRFDRGPADRDRNCLFPIDRLRELAALGRIGGLTDRHFSTAYTAAFREFAATTAERVAQAVERERPGAVLLTAGCRACHRTAAALQRAIEAAGIPAVAITAEPEETEQARVSRALAPPGAVPGRPAGPPGDATRQRQVVLAALDLLRDPARPGEVVGSLPG